MCHIPLTNTLSIVNECRLNVFSVADCVAFEWHSSGYCSSRADENACWWREFGVEWCMEHCDQSVFIHKSCNYCRITRELASRADGKSAASPSPGMHELIYHDISVIRILPEFWPKSPHVSMSQCIVLLCINKWAITSYSILLLVSFRFILTPWLVDCGFNLKPLLYLKINKLLPHTQYTSWIVDLASSHWYISK